MGVEDTLLQKRFAELSMKAYNKNIYTHTGFLTMMEIDLFERSKKNLAPVPYRMYGGYEESERCVLRFGDSETTGYEEEFPVSCIKIMPTAAKFADDLTHRDFLGALLNLGVERSVIGDILVKEKEAYVFCLSNMAEFLMDNLFRVRHTTIKCSLVKAEDMTANVQYEEVSISAASERADIILSKLYHLSRTTASELFRTKKVYINARMTENNSAILKAEDIVSVRGYGKFLYGGLQYVNKKGNNVVIIKKYQ